jgi:hypothetical protein
LVFRFAAVNAAVKIPLVAVCQTQVAATMPVLVLLAIIAIYGVRPVPSNGSPSCNTVQRYVHPFAWYVRNAVALGCVNSSVRSSITGADWAMVTRAASASIILNVMFNPPEW